MTTVRPMTDEDRRWLDDEVGRAPRIGIVAPLLIYAIVIGTVLPGFIFAIAWKVILAVIGVVPLATGWRENPVSFWGIVSFTTALGCYLMWDITRSVVRNAIAARKRELGCAQDIAGGTVAEEDHMITEAKCFREPEHGGRMYFLHTAEGKTRVIYDDESLEFMTEDDAESDGSGLLRRDMRIITYPHSGLVRTILSGEALPKPRATTITVNPKLWPEDETWCDIPWADLKTVLAPPKKQKGRPV